MDLYPLYNSVRIALISTAVIFLAGTAAAYYISKLPRTLKGILDVILTVPLVLPPTVIGYLLLRVLGPNRLLGGFFMEYFDLRLTMNWWSTVFATTVVCFPLMYRTCRGIFESFDENIILAAKTLGLSNIFIFWRLILPVCKSGIIAGLVLSFTRALGEYGATSMVSGYIPKETATISTTVYQLWRTENDALAVRWVVINLLISFMVLMFMNMFENRRKKF
ncbi:molybdate transport system permease protein [Ruminobacter amylophilus]|uniref:Molybdenum transport system permease n=1 Tax=Ruminobacter amylophilus TaxID=867 RepID=A0A662ZK33_9GAMM|nr:molybdate ABC transporter permease subunit [Ruminobacter amylophilus]SFP32056.1 molybdate transport system permease protein [Ruminobacter amylophilus]